MPRVCIDLTANEMVDRHGGIGRYGYLLLRALLSLPESERAGIELCALEESDAPVITAEQALDRLVLGRPPIPRWRPRRPRPPRRHDGADRRAGRRPEAVALRRRRQPPSLATALAHASPARWVR